MRLFRWICLGFGIALFGVIIANTDVEEAMRLVLRMGWGIAAILLIYLATFLGDAASWQITLRTVPLTPAWFYRLWIVRMIGEAFNNTLPAGGMGGEPVKAVLLNRHFGVAYQDGTASLFLAKTVNMIALVGFLAVGFILMLGTDKLPDRYILVTGIGLAVLSTAILAFFLVQRWGVSSIVIAWLSRWSGGRRMASAIARTAEVERRFEDFYARSRPRFGAALGLAFGVWVLSTVEIFVALSFLGHSVSWVEAWIIEAAAQLVRTATFFIPASLGALDGALLLLCTAFTGSPTVGIAVVLVRRLREIVWIAWGFGLNLALPKPRNGGGD